VARDCASGTQLAPLTRRTAGRCGGAGVLEARPQRRPGEFAERLGVPGVRGEGGGREKPSNCARNARAGGGATSPPCLRNAPGPRPSSRDVPAAPAFFLSLADAKHAATSHRIDLWRPFRPWRASSHPPTLKPAFCGLDRNVPARRPELRARSDPCIVCAKRG
jgi:hypothetical protein